MGQAIAMLRGGLDLSMLVGKTITLDDMPRWFDEFLRRKTNNKIIVVAGSEKQKRTSEARPFLE